MLLGQFDARLGSGKRVSFPKKFREVLGKRLIITKGLDGNLIVVSEANWKILLEGTEDKPFTNKRARELQALLLGNAFEVELDELGRFVIAEHLREHAGITNEIVFAGFNRYVQIWDKKRWEAYQKRIQETIEQEELPRDE